MPYTVLQNLVHHRDHHRPGTVSHAGRCGLHGCGEDAVVSLEVEDRSGHRLWLAACERGAREYGPRPSR